MRALAGAAMASRHAFSKPSLLSYGASARLWTGGGHRPRARSPGFWTGNCRRHGNRQAPRAYGINCLSRPRPWPYRQTLPRARLVERGQNDHKRLLCNATLNAAFGLGERCALSNDESEIGASRLSGRSRHGRRARPSPPAPRRRSRKAEDHAPPEVAKLEASNRDRPGRDNGGKTAGISKPTDQDGKPRKDDGREKDQYLEP
jgi:hypothetical protein